MSAGKRNKQITFQTPTTVKNSVGEKVETWGNDFAEWVQIFFGSGDERRQAAREQGVQTATFRALSNTRTRALDLTARILYDGSTWDIRAIVPMDDGHIEFTAVRER